MILNVQTWEWSQSFHLILGKYYVSASSTSMTSISLSFIPAIASVVEQKSHPRGPKDTGVVDLKEYTLHIVSVPWFSAPFSWFVIDSSVHWPSLNFPSSWPPQEDQYIPQRPKKLFYATTCDRWGAVLMLTCIFTSSLRTTTSTRLIAAFLDKRQPCALSAAVWAHLFE